MHQILTTKCYIMVSVVREAILEALGSSNRELTLDPTVTLSALISKLRDSEPLLYKFRRNNDPSSPDGTKKWSRLEIANAITYVLFGSNERAVGFVAENGKESPSEILAHGVEDESKALFDKRNLIGELSKPTVEVQVSFLDNCQVSLLRCTVTFS